MITSIILALAMAAETEPSKPITIAGDAPTIVIPLARYDLSRAGDIRHLRARIRFAASSVCDISYAGIRDPRTLACRNNAVADADAQLGRFLAHQSSAALTSAIAITRPGR